MANDECNRDEKHIVDVEEFRLPCGRVGTCFGCGYHNYTEVGGHYCAIWGFKNVSKKDT